MNRNVILIGYSGHAFVIADIFHLNGIKVIGYCDQVKKENNPLNISYYGDENSEESFEVIKKNDYFVCIGDNLIREKIQSALSGKIKKPVIAIHPSAYVASSVKLGNGVMIGANVSVNPYSDIGDGVICNTNSVIEHECKVGDFSHIAPGAVLLGGVKVGRKCLIGGNSVVKQGVKIGDNVTIGAGSVIISDIPDNKKVVGNPHRIL